MKYKLLAIDIDDTILPRFGIISEACKAAVKRAENAGIYVTLATGRGFHGSSSVIRELGISRLVINYGGALISDAATGKPFMTTELDPETVNFILELADELGLHAHLYQGDEIVYEKEHPYGKAYSEHLGLPARIDPDIRKKRWQNVPKVLIITEPEDVERLIPYFTEKLEGRAAVFASSPGFIEFNKIGASKGSALRILAEHLGISQEETAAIGDNTLDSDMIEWAGLGGCVAGGSPVCIKAAEIIAPSCEDDGVAWFIDNCVLNEPVSVSVGFDIGGTTLKAGLIDSEYNVIKKVQKPTPFGDPEAMLKLLKDTARELAGNMAIDTVGITVPGSVNSRGAIVDAWNIGLHNVELKSLAERIMPAKRVKVCNDADAACKAEIEKGVLKGVGTGLMLTLGTGVGGSIVFEGKTFGGGMGRGTELGHAVLERGGIKCGCGRRGCIETLCSATALKRKAEEAVKNGVGMIALLASQGAKPDAKLLIDCAKAGDETAVSLFNEYLDALGDAVASFVNVFDPEMIAIGGGVSGAGEFMLEPLRKLVAEKCFFGSCGRIEAAVEGNDAGMIGSIL